MLGMTRGGVAGAPGATSMRSARVAPLPLLRSGCATCLCAHSSRSPQSTVSEASEKRQQQQQQHRQQLDTATQPKPSAVKHEERPFRPQPPAEAAQQQQQQQQTQTQTERERQEGSKWWRERRRQAQRAAGMTKMEEFMRDTPGLNRFVDGTLILGDAVMVLATQFASERVPVGEAPYLAAVAVLSWILAGAVMGDYKAEPDPDENPLSNSLGWPVVVSIANATITWAVAMLPSMLGFSILISNYLVAPETVLELERDGMLSPQLEISVALMVTMLCWRGMATRLRMRD